MVETHSADLIQTEESVQSADAFQSKRVRPSADAGQSPERIYATCPAPFSPEEVSRWERKGRGLAVFRCPDTFCLPEIESRPGTAILVDPVEDREIPGEPDRLVLKLTTRCTPHLNCLLNRIVLPAYRRYIPLYLFASWNEEDLDTGAVPVPDKDEIEAAMLPLMKEQLRSLLAFTCTVFPNVEAMSASRNPWMTAVEVMMHEGLTRTGLPHRLHVQLGPACVDALVGGALVGNAQDGAVVVEIDGREFVHDDRNRWDTELIKKNGIREVVRFSGSEVVHDLDGCVERVRSTLMGRGRGTGRESGAGHGNEPPIRIPEPDPSLAGEQAGCLTPGPAWCSPSPRRVPERRGC